jgi:hypothetical protein
MAAVTAILNALLGGETCIGSTCIAILNALLGGETCIGSTSCIEEL